MNLNLGQNKLLVGLGAGFLLGFLVLGVLFFRAFSAASDAKTRYNDQVRELTRLQNLPLYPETSNLPKLEEQQADATDAAVRLHEKLLPMAFPLEPLTPEQFQDQLNATVKRLSEKAAASGIAMADNYLGFSEYRSAIPKADAAPALGRQLRGIELAVETMIDRRVASIDRISRTPLPEEAAVAAAPTPAPRGQPAKPVLLTKYPFEIQFVAEQQAFQTVLNDLSKNSKQFFIIQPLSIKNQGLGSTPRKSDPSTLLSTESDNVPKTEKMEYVLGAEKLTVTLQFDAVVFAGELPK